MLTTCTACGTQFRVGTAQLRAVHGLVRCSRCHSVFDAFETLREEFEAASAAPQAPADELSAPDDTAAVPGHQEPPLISATVTTPIVDIDGLDIQMRSAKPAAPADDLFADLWGESPAPTAATAPTDSVPEHTDKYTPVLIEDHIPKPPALVRDQALYKHVQLPPRERQAPKTPRQPRTINVWGVGVAFMALLLGIQFVNAQRLVLSQYPGIGPPLSALYSALGSPVAAPPRPSAWLVSNINVTSDPDTPGALSITGTLANSASLAQPWPILRIELMDRYGDPLRARDFIAKIYLPVNQAAAWLNPGMAARFRIDVVDPGPEAVGFQVQPCFDLASSRECSSDMTD
ncbi:MAG TPA: zinc-ribbon and DUF3426 domain-containing protein [Gammaproteobacteria bacterium]|nr:zinc-ribbon and DUF3426 domain-containing protein [Gammaproteobacteria bacterium]